MPLLRHRGLRKSFGDRSRCCAASISRWPSASWSSSSARRARARATLLRCVNRLEEPTAGRIVFDGVEVTSRATDLNALRRSMGMVFQSFNLYPHMTALGNVTLALRKVLKKPRDEAESIGRQALADVGLADKARKLSERAVRRPAAARRHRPRARARPASIVLFDEPTSALDPELVGSRARRHARPQGARHDHAGRQPRDALCPRRRRPRHLHGPGPHRRGRPAASRSSRARSEDAHARLRRRARAR